MTRPLLRALLGLPLLLAASGCLGRSPATRFYTLEPVDGPTIEGLENGLGVAVGPVGVPRYLDRPQIVSRDGTNEVVIDDFRRWAGGLEANVRRVLGANLAQRLETNRVAAGPTDAPFPIDYQVVVDFDELVAVHGSGLTLSARWVIRRPGGEALVVENSSLNHPLASDSVAATIRAHQGALGELADLIAARIVDLSRVQAEPPAGEPSEEPTQSAE